jgi:hypothetical protein
MRTTEWERYAPDRHSHCAGNYIFLLKPFRLAPYYAGETDCFSRRFERDHGGLFRQGLRTFFRTPFIRNATDRSHKGFGVALERAQKPNRPNPDLIYVAGNSTDLTDIAEGLDFWSNNVVLLVCQTATTRTERHLIEARVQEDIMTYYEASVGNAIEWRLPPRSRIVGHRPPSPSPAPAILYGWLGCDDAMDAADFFSSLERQPRLPVSQPFS